MSHPLEPEKYRAEELQLIQKVRNDTISPEESYRLVLLTSRYRQILDLERDVNWDLEYENRPSQLAHLELLAKHASEDRVQRQLSRYRRGVGEALHPVETQGGKDEDSLALQMVNDELLELIRTIPNYGTGITLRLLELYRLVRLRLQGSEPTLESIVPSLGYQSPELRAPFYELRRQLYTLRDNGLPGEDEEMDNGYILAPIYRAWYQLRLQVCTDMTVTAGNLHQALEQMAITRLLPQRSFHNRRNRFMTRTERSRLRARAQNHHIGNLVVQRHRLDMSKEGALVKVPLESLAEDARECSICTDEYVPTENVEAVEGCRNPTRLPCGHIFSRECIRTWLRQSGTCPLRCTFEDRYCVALRLRY